MIDPQRLNEMLRARVFVMKMLWTMLTLTILLFVALAYFITSKQEMKPPPVEPAVKIALYAVGVAVAIASYFLRGVFLRGRAQSTSNRDAELRRAFNDAQPAETDAGVPAHEKRMKSVEAQVSGLAGRYFTALLLSLALHEAIALLGMILAMMESRFESVLPFAIAAIVLDLIVYPRPGQYVEQNAVGASSF